MSETINLEDHRRKLRGDPPVILKEVDGEVIRCADIDALPPHERAKYFSTNNEAFDEMVALSQKMGLYDPPFNNPLIRKPISTNQE